MKNLVPVLIMILLSTAGCIKEKPSAFTILGEYQYPPYNAYPEKINGRIKKLAEKSYWALQEGTTFRKGDPITRKEKDSLGLKNNILATFDEEGNFITDYLTDEKDNAFFRLDFSKKDNKLERMKATLDGNDVAYQTFEYSNEGRISGYRSFNPQNDSLLNYMTISYSPDNETVTHNWFNSKNVPTAKYVYHYDGSGIFLGRESYNGEGEFMAAIGIKNNEKGKVSELTIIDRDRNPVYTRSLTYEYDKNDNWIKAVAIDNKGQAVFQVREYIYYR